MGRLAVPQKRGRVLVIEDDPHVRFGMIAGLRSAGYELLEAESCAEAFELFRSGPLEAVVTDLRLPDGNVLDLLPRMRGVDPSVPIFIVTGYGSIDVAVTAVKHGAEDFLTKPVDLARLLELVGRAADRRGVTQSGKRRRVRPPLRWQSRAMLQLEEQVERLRDADCSVLILGETGTGKSVLARRLHDIGARAGHPFVDVNCAGLSRELVESELFGHERGAFTGAHAQKSGLFDAANGGTLFLDEIGDIDTQVQPKLLKVLEEKRFRRIGDVREREVDVRLFAATHHDLLASVSQKAFRADLYYRISTVTLTVPSLRERPEDVLTLAEAMVEERAEGIALDRDAQQKLRSYPWPGNIRELKNVVERALLLRKGDVIRDEDIRFDVSAPTPPTAFVAPVVPEVAPPMSEPSPSTSRLLASDASAATRGEIEREHIKLALAAENGRVEAAAKRLGMPRSTLYLKLKTYGITTSRPRSLKDEK